MEIKFKDMFFKFWVYFSGAMVVLVTLGLFVYLLYKGIGVISFEFIFDFPKGIPLGTDGGIFPAIMGSLMSAALAGIIGGVLGLCTSIYMVFYCTSSNIKAYVSQALKCLASIPSVVIGLFGYSILVFLLGFNRSLLSVSITLAIMIIPFIEIRIQKALEETSSELFISCLSLGISKSYTITHLVIPNVFRGVMTSLGLGIVFAMGATAPIMFTGAVINAGVPTKLSDPIMALPYHLYILVNEGLSVEMAYGTAFVLIVLLLIINLVCHFIGDFKGVE